MRSLEKNAYLCPEFVLPSLATGKNRPPPLALIAVGGELDGPEIRGLGIFEPAAPTAKFPMLHLRAYKSPHSFLGGILIREDEARVTATEMMRYLIFGRHRWNAVYFSDMPQDGPQAELLTEICTLLDITWYVDHESQRASLDLRPGNRDAWKGHVSRSRMKSINRCRIRLARLGELEWRYVGKFTGEYQVEAFLQLEHLGWKSDKGTSLRSSSTDERFFRQIVVGFRRVHGVFFTELVLDGTVIASVCSFSVGDQGFGFKTAFDPQYAKMAPGFINEYQFLKALDSVAHIIHLDSGAAEGSYIDELWPGRRPLGNGFFVGRRSAKPIAAAVDALRRTRRRVLRGLRQMANISR